MSNYNIISLKRQENGVRTYKICKPFSRCNDYKSCPHCAKIWQHKTKAEKTYHLTEEQLNRYEHKKYIVIRSRDEHTNVYMKNADIDFFIKDFISKKRNINFVVNSDSEYFISKEISHHDDYGYNPHANIILLTNKEFDLDNEQLQDLLSKYNLHIDIQDIYTKDNSYKKSIENLILYCTKFDNKRAELETDIELTKGKRNIFNSKLFNKDKYKELQSYLYINIKEVKQDISSRLKAAKQIFKRNANKKHIKNYIRLLKSYRKKEKYLKSLQHRKINRLRKRFRSKNLQIVRTLN